MFHDEANIWHFLLFGTINIIILWTLFVITQNYIICDLGRRSIRKIYFVDKRKQLLYSFLHACNARSDHVPGRATELSPVRLHVGRAGTARSACATMAARSCPAACGATATPARPHARAGLTGMGGWLASGSRQPGDASTYSTYARAGPRDRSTGRDRKRPQLAELEVPY